MTQWCISTLQDRFNAASIKISGDQATLKFFNTKVSGEASTTIRKGRKIVVSELFVKSDWTCKQYGVDGNFIADGNGGLEIPELTLDDIDAANINIVCDSDHPARQQLYEAVKTEGRQQIRKLLQSFADEMKMRG